MIAPVTALPQVIGHRGAPGHRPENTLASYRLAVRLGADAIEPDLVPTRDGVLVARHEHEISRTTDVALHPELADRRCTKVVGGREVTGWFTEDLTLAELRTLRAVERHPRLRPGNTRYDGRWPVPTLDEICALVHHESRRSGRRIRLCAEVKEASYFASIGLPVESTLLEVLARHRLDGPGGRCQVQSFEEDVLRGLAGRTELPLVQLVDAGERPDVARVATYAQVLGVHTSLATPALVAEAHAAGLAVHAWTLRAELVADPYAEARTLLDAGVDGLFSDQPGLTVEARAQWLAAQEQTG
ncbi:glycerophosphodiester phosphodiesterase [Nocardioides sp. zg-579]|uniref:glycerophosphodiester phosphodiesterase n=1 Tax=Nocardioides marmotae TaxID=2663857 RepID=A0A6I3JAM2_9ACTN|nr:glycerophosphodiester phosphodiesterase family protein [Nocardioides marmotae]MCR6031277.1 glycerophosphodiester phosphodiesterase [Gordonia jinghuaiqii]MTB94915.1 glycerophosphodiester phosphodiesterase [Nocardioides marmotae]QKE02573.1 glycerophosphodiester phosphodiesterase [Nocardioides marmotae]